MGLSKPYAERDDLERLASSWVKHQGFMARGEWSAAIIRAATAVEIATNIAIRHELQINRKLEREFVDSLLHWANGLDGKINKILKPLPIEEQKRNVINTIRPKLNMITEKRNQVVHSGNFMNKKEANDVHGRAEGFIDALVGLYHAGYSVTIAANGYKNSKPKQPIERIGVQNF